MRKWFDNVIEAYKDVKTRPDWGKKSITMPAPPIQLKVWNHCYYSNHELMYYY